jgi:tetratricopeptide (TPR) repeat protein
MMRFLLPVALLFSTIPIAAAAEIDKAPIRKALRLPTLSAKVDISFDFDEGIVFRPIDEQEVAAEIAAIENNPANKASDAVRHSRLATLYLKLNDNERAKQALKEAIKSYRLLIEAEPKNARLRADLALALCDSEKDDAEKLLRQAAQLAPRDWYVTAAKGQFLVFQGTVLLTGGEKADTNRFVQILASLKAEAKTLAKFERTIDEARECFNQAVELAPRDPDARLQRAVFRGLFFFYRTASKASDAREINPFAMQAFQELVADVHEWAKLRPDDPKALTAALFFEIAGSGVKPSNEIKDAAALIAAMPERTRLSVEEKLRSLEQAMQSKDPQKAAAAAVFQGMLFSAVLRDMERAEKVLRRAVELQPLRDLGWEYLAAALAYQEKYKEGLEVCLNRLKHRDNVHNRLLAAKCHEALDEFDEAEKQVRLALKMDPKDITCRLALAALLLRHDNADDVEAAGKLLRAIEEALNDATPDALRGDFSTTIGAYLALTGDPTKGRAYVDAILKRDPGNKYARRVSVALLIAVN